MEKKIEIEAIKGVNEKIGGKLFIPKGKGPFPAVIFFHGSGGTGDTHFETAKMLSEHGILGFAFNYQGVGLSGGKFEDQTISNAVSDGVAAISHLLFQVDEADNTRIGFVGGSLGGYIAAIIAGLKNQDAKSMVLVSPAAYAESAVNNQRDADRDLEKGFEDSLSYKMIRNFKGDLMVQICEEDNVLPKGMAEIYYNEAINAKSKNLYIIKGAKHRISVQPKQKKESQDKIVEWFLKTL